MIAVPLAAQMPKYGVTVNVDADNVDFAAFRTYAWVRGQASFYPTIDSQIVAAVDGELVKLGMSEAVAPGAPDVLVTYASTNRTDVDLKAEPDAAGVRPKYSVGTLVVVLLDPRRKRLLRLRIDQPLEAEPDKLAATIQSAVAQLFEKYPTRRKR